MAILIYPQLTTNNSQHPLSALGQLGSKHYFIEKCIAKCKSLSHHRHLNFYNRLKTAYSLIKEVIPFYSIKNKNRNILWKLYHEIKEIVENSALEKKIKKYEIKLSVFSQLRDALGTVPRNVNNGLCRMKETGTRTELKAIKRAVANFKTDLRKKIKATDDKSLCNSFKKIIDKLNENGKKLFSDPMTVYVSGEKRIIFILRTNNILEQHFRRFIWMAQACRLCRTRHNRHYAEFRIMSS